MPGGRGSIGIHFITDGVIPSAGTGKARHRRWGCGQIEGIYLIALVVAVPSAPDDEAVAPGIGETPAPRVHHIGTHRSKGIGQAAEIVSGADTCQHRTRELLPRGSGAASGG